jgi:hypothetical protein
VLSGGLGFPDVADVAFSLLQLKHQIVEERFAKPKKLKTLLTGFQRQHVMQ